MNALRDRIDELIRANRLQWSRNGDTVEVELWRSGRRQRVQLDLADRLYVFRSVVVGSAYVTRTESSWRDLAYRVWRKNSLKDLITFSFDTHHRLIGQIEQPGSPTIDSNGHDRIDSVVARLGISDSS